MNTTTLTKLSMNVLNANKLVNYLLDENINLSGTIMLGLLGSLEMYKNIIETRVEDNSIVYIFDTKFVNFYTKNIYIKNIQIYTVNVKEDDFEDFTVKLKNMPKFDFIIQNPPYNKSLHLDFFNKGLDLLSDTGKMVIIEPSTWLIELRQNIAEKKSSQMKKYIAIKERIKGHVSKVVIENFNKEFNVGLYVPCSITYIDKSKEYKQIEYSNCGIKKYINSLCDCNLIGNYEIIKSIFEKLNNYGKVINHICHENKQDKNIYYAKCLAILGRSFCGDPRWSDVWFINDLYAQPTYWQTFDTRMETPISKTPHRALKNGYHYDNPVYTNKIVTNIYGTLDELTNLQHNIYNTKLFPFINICLTIDQNNTSLHYVPWLVDKQYTDEEIYTKFGFTNEEIKLIETTIKKYKRYSPWFKRYMCGPSSVSDEEVQKFINELENEKN